MALQGFQAFGEVSAGFQGVLLEAFLADHPKYFEADRAGNRVSSKGVEIFHAIVEGIGNGPRGNDCRQRVAVADGFAHSDDVGNDALGFKSPEMRAGSAKSRLHLIRNADASRRPDQPVRGLEIPGRQHDLPAAADHRFAEESSRAFAFLPELVQNRLNMGSECWPRLRIAIPVQAPVRIRNGQHVRMRRGSFAAGSVEFIRTHVHASVGVAVVANFHHEHIFLRRVGFGQPEGQFVGFAAGIDQEDHLHRRREGG